MVPTPLVWRLRAKSRTLGASAATELIKTQIPVNW
jgi:hypothetical protein